MKFVPVGFVGLHVQPSWMHAASLGFVFIESFDGWDCTQVGFS